MSRARFCLIFLTLACSGGATAAERPARASRDLLVLYTFERPEADQIIDRSGVGEPLNLKSETRQGMSWRSDHLTVSGSVRIQSMQPPRKAIAAIKQSQELTIEAWIRPADNKQTGPARIVTLSADTGLRNFTLGQDAGKFDVRLRTSTTNVNGIPSVGTPDGLVKPELTHVACRRDKEGLVQIFVNGKVVTEQKVDGDLNGWSDDYRLSLANELTGDRPWQGDLHLVALYSRAISSDELAQNFAAGVPTPIDYAAILPAAANRKVDFVSDVQPIFRQKCFECHAQGNEEGGLNLGLRRQAMAGGTSGPVILPGNSSASRLIHMVAAVRKSEVMPPEGRLSPEQVGILRAWIDQGAEWPTSADVLDPRTEAAKQHWAFRPLQEVTPPTVKNEAGVKTPIDYFVLRKLDEAGLLPSPPASSPAIIRRVSFDTIGLPPSPQEVQDYVAAAQKDPDAAFAALIERMLESPHFGERWARHWLDVARYADSDGQETDRDRPLAYRYRDFVIRALNDDMPFDQFVRWQLAGNEYEPENAAAVAATGFLTAGPFAGLGDNLLEDERLRNRYNELDDIVSTIGTGLLGLTLGCVRCHDHKYDAIPARDYYSILSALNSGDRGEVTLPSNDKVYAFRDGGSEPKPGWLFRRGDYYDRAIPVSLGFVSIMTRDRAPEDYLAKAKQQAVKSSTMQRRALAEWMTDVDQGAGPLVARVIVNRVWQHHFGEALVRTVGDFGVRSEPPTHPELLEWLARDLVQNGWKLKRLHRMILSSAVYLQDSKASDNAARRQDPDNRLLWRMRPQRLEAEILRDSMLAVSGTLNREMYGPGFKPPISSEAIVARNTKDPYPAKVDDSPAIRRRSIYMFHKRVVPYPLLQAFDKPDAQQSCNRRDPTTVAPQALALLNDSFVRQTSLAFADRLIRESGPEPQAWVEGGYRLSLGRAPGESEREASIEFVERQIKERSTRNPNDSADETRRRALADLCQAWFSLNEFLYID
jgi:mono/diheme cytochrome c family protein